MPDLGPYVEQQLANMSETEFDALAARVREPAELTPTPMEKAAAALRRSRGLDRKTPATKEQAAAMRDYAANR